MLASAAGIASADRGPPLPQGPGVQMPACGENQICGSKGGRSFVLATTPNHIVLTLDQGLSGGFSIWRSRRSARSERPLFGWGPYSRTPRLRSGYYYVWGGVSNQNGTADVLSFSGI